jgi:hypothetical protein
MQRAAKHRNANFARSMLLMPRGAKSVVGFHWVLPAQPHPILAPAIGFGSNGTAIFPFQIVVRRRVVICEISFCDRSIKSRLG